MNGIIPNWEWRTFGKEIPLRVDLEKIQKTIRIDRSETYIISIIAEECFKIQECKLRIDRLHQVNKDGFEQWMLEDKIKFPMNIEEIQMVYKLFRLSIPRLIDKDYLKEEFIDIAKKNRRLIVSQIDKVINIYDIGGCIVEKTKLRIDGKSATTIAVKDPDSHLIRKTLIDLGVENRKNQSYNSAIKLSKSDLLS